MDCLDQFKDFQASLFLGWASSWMQLRRYTACMVAVGALISGTCHSFRPLVGLPRSPHPPAPQPRAPRPRLALPSLPAALPAEAPGACGENHGGRGGCRRGSGSKHPGSRSGGSQRRHHRHGSSGSSSHAAAGAIMLQAADLIYQLCMQRVSPPSQAIGGACPTCPSRLPSSLPCSVPEPAALPLPSARGRLAFTHKKAYVIREGCLNLLRVDTR